MHTEMQPQLFLHGLGHALHTRSLYPALDLTLATPAIHIALIWPFFRGTCLTLLTLLPPTCV